MDGRDDDCDAISGDNGNGRDGAIEFCVGMAFPSAKHGESCTLGHGVRAAARLSVVFFPTPTSPRAVCIR